MSKPIAYATTAMHDKLAELGVVISRGTVEMCAEIAVRTFLEDVKREGLDERPASPRVVIDSLLRNI